MSRLRNHRPIHRFERLIVFALAALIPMVSFAIVTRPSTYNYVGSGMGGVAGASPPGVYTRATFEVVGDAGKTTFASKTFKTSYDTLGKLVRGAATTGRGLIPMVAASLIATGLIEGAGWAIDELRKQVVAPGSEEEEPVVAGTEYFEVRMDGAQMLGRYVTAISACEAIKRYLQTNRPGEGGRMTYTFQPPVIGRGWNGPNKMYGCVIHWNDSVAHSSGETEYTMQGVFYDVTTSQGKYATNYTPEHDVTDEELGRKLAAAPAEDIDEILAPSGQVISTPELVQALNELTKALEDQKGLPNSEPRTADPEFADGEDTTQPQEKEWPGFCDWAKPVCDFIKWVKTDDDLDNPETPIEQETVTTVSWSSGLGGGSCPSPESVAISVGPINTTVPIGYDTICTAMSFMRPVFIVMAGVLAAFIVGGFRGGGNA